MIPKAKMIERISYVVRKELENSVYIELFDEIGKTSPIILRLDMRNIIHILEEYTWDKSLLIAIPSNNYNNNKKLRLSLHIGERIYKSKWVESYEIT